MHLLKEHIQKSKMSQNSKSSTKSTLNPTTIENKEQKKNKSGGFSEWLKINRSDVVQYLTLLNDDNFTVDDSAIMREAIQRWKSLNSNEKSKWTC